jgi:hypothetical protein
MRVLSGCPLTQGETVVTCPVTGLNAMTSDSIWRHSGKQRTEGVVVVSGSRSASADTRVDPIPAAHE